VSASKKGTTSMVDRHTSEDSSFLADGLAGSTPPETFATGRTCVAEDCSVKLSRYNSTDWCALHESPASTHRPYDTSTRQRGRTRRTSARKPTAGSSTSNGNGNGNGSGNGSGAPGTPQKSSRTTAA
jgi:hypothetical protein